MASGVEFTTLSYNVPAYLAWLYGEYWSGSYQNHALKVSDSEQITSRGVKVVEGWVGSFADVEFVPGSENQVKTDVIVNASGLGESGTLLKVKLTSLYVRCQVYRWRC